MVEGVIPHPRRQVPGPVLKSPKEKAARSLGKLQELCGWKAKGKGHRRQYLKICQDIGPSLSGRAGFVRFVSQKGMDGKEEVEETWRGKKMRLGHHKVEMGVSSLTGESGLGANTEFWWP